MTVAFRQLYKEGPLINDGRWTAALHSNKLFLNIQQYAAENAYQKSNNSVFSLRSIRRFLKNLVISIIIVNGVMSVVAVRWAAIMFYRKITQKKVVIIVIIIIIAIIIIIIIAVIVIIIIAVTTSLSMGIRGTPVTRSSPSLSYKRILPFKPILFPRCRF